jgi:hypothetical protein
MGRLDLARGIRAKGESAEERQCFGGLAAAMKRGLYKITNTINTINTINTAAPTTCSKLKRYAIAAK